MKDKGLQFSINDGAVADRQSRQRVMNDLIGIQCQPPNSPNDRAANGRMESFHIFIGIRKGYKSIFHFLARSESGRPSPASASALMRRISSIKTGSWAASQSSSSSLVSADSKTDTGIVKTIFSAGSPMCITSAKRVTKPSLVCNRFAGGCEGGLS